MNFRALLGALLIVTGFWYLTSRSDLNLRRFVVPFATSTHLWAEPVTARGSGFFPDEQNNIDIYKENRLATVNITSIVYQRDMFFQIFPSKGSGSGFIINEGGEIVTNNH